MNICIDLIFISLVILGENTILTSRKLLKNTVYDTIMSTQRYVR